VIFHITCPKSIRETFKVAALDAFPREKYAVLFGRRKGNRVAVVDAWYPEDQRKFSTVDAMTADIISRKSWLQKAEDIAQSGGLTVVGDIHSHPHEVKNRRLHYRDRSPSEKDWSRLWPAGVQPGWIVGICLISKSPRHTRVRVRLWPSLPETKVHWSSK